MSQPPTAPPDAAAAAVAPRRWQLAFPAEVEARYEADTRAQRRRDLLLAGVVALVIYDLFLVNDWFSRPEVMATAVLWRLGVVSVYGGLVLGAIHRGLPAFWREAAMASTSVVAMVASCTIFAATTSPSGIYDPFLFSLIFLANNIVFRLRFMAALVSSLAGLLVAAVFLLGDSPLPPIAQPFAMGLLMATLVFTVLACYRLERAERQAYLLVLRETTRSEVAMQAAGHMAALSQTDALTQLANRRAFDDELPRRWNEAADHGQGMAALLIDIDHFKRYNDHYGHPAGDACLRRVAQLMREVLRDDDFIARIGGEEFAVLLQHRDELGADQVAERLRQHIEGAAIPHDGQDGRQVVSISVGLAQTHPPQPISAPDLIAAADAALYQAKHQGRNRWVRWQDDAPVTV